MFEVSNEKMFAFSMIVFLDMIVTRSTAEVFETFCVC